MSRAGRKMGINIPDTPPPASFSQEEVEFCLKLVAYWEGGPDPDSPNAVPVGLVLEKGGRDE
jgi:hypothetical protein